MRLKLTSLLLLVACASLAQVSYVVEPGTRVADPSDAPYGSWETAATNIQTAINAAVAAGWTNVWVSNGIYYLDKQIEIKNPMTLRSWKDGELDREGTIIDGTYPDKNIRCVYLTHAEAVVRGFTIRNGQPPGSSSYAGGAYLLSTAVLDNCLIISNTAPYGGGVYLHAGGVVTGCVIAANSASHGGGVYVREGLVTHSRITDNTGTMFGGGLRLNNDATMRFCVIDANLCTRAERNSSRGGGGLSMWDDSVVEDCVISNNVAYGCGGGVNMTGGTLRRCLITDNEAGSSGATFCGGGGLDIQVRAESGKALLDSCQILRNRASTGSWGGGILTWEDKGMFELRNCLIAANTAVRSGGGIHAYRGVFELDNCTITDNHVTDSIETTRAGGVHAGYTNHFRNTIIYGNTIAGSSTRPNISVYFTVIATFTNTCVSPLQTGRTGSKVINENSFADDPLLTEDYQLTLGSPCVNEGVYQEWMYDAKDIAGRSRLDRFSGIPDIGCFEYVPSGSMFHLR